LTGPVSAFTPIVQIGDWSGQARRRHRRQRNGLAIELGAMSRTTIDERIAVRSCDFTGLLGSVPAWNIPVVHE
jgi:hypothetical protein